MTIHIPLARGGVRAAVNGQTTLAWFVGSAGAFGPSARMSVLNGRRERNITTVFAHLFEYPC